MKAARSVDYTHRYTVAMQSEPRLGAPQAQPARAMSSSSALVLLCGLMLRLTFLHRLSVPGTPSASAYSDAAGYGGVAANILRHGQILLADSSGLLHPTMARLPGYPLFLAACFALFGIGNYRAVCLVQIALDLAGCLLLADLVQKIASPRLAARASAATLWLAALCPFCASYAALPLTECPTLFCISLALWSAQCFRTKPRWRTALVFTMAIVCATLLRPDGALVGVALAPALIVRDVVSRLGSARLARMAIICGLLALAPFALWAGRNWRVFHRFEPLAPRYAKDPGDSDFPGIQRWFRTWNVDFVSTSTVYWPIPSGPLDIRRVPARAFGSPAQYATATALFAQYNVDRDPSPELDDAFGRLAAEQVAEHPWRYYLGLPLARVADMWFRPRIENLSMPLDWWSYSRHRAATIFSWGYVALNLFYVAMGLAGLWLKPQLWRSMLFYFVARSLLLSMLEGPEVRYTLEFFPIFFALGGITCAAIYRRLISRYSDTV